MRDHEISCRHLIIPLVTTKRVLRIVRRFRGIDDATNEIDRETRATTKCRQRNGTNDDLELISLINADPATLLSVPLVSYFTNYENKPDMSEMASAKFLFDKAVSQLTVERNLYSSFMTNEQLS